GDLRLPLDRLAVDRGEEGPQLGEERLPAGHRRLVRPGVGRDELRAEPAQVQLAREARTFPAALPCLLRDPPCLALVDLCRGRHGSLPASLPGTRSIG